MGSFVPQAEATEEHPIRAAIVAIYDALAAEWAAMTNGEGMASLIPNPYCMICMSLSRWLGFSVTM